MVVLGRRAFHIIEIPLYKVGVGSIQLRLWPNLLAYGRLQQLML
jgi:hypothetical protein